MEILHLQCKLCSTIITDHNFEIIDDVVKDIMKVLLLKLSFDSKVQCVMCRDCSSRMYAAFNFKQMCLYSNNSPFPHFDCKNSSSTHFNQIRVKEEETKPVAANGKKCQLCTQTYANYDYMSLQAVPVKAICLYFPEIDFKVTKDPEICGECFETLCTHSAFIKNCSDLNEHSCPILNDSFIKTEEIQIKSETNDEDSHPPNSKSDESYLENKKNESDKHKQEGNVEYHDTKGFSVSQMYVCEVCTYETQRWSHFTLHQLTHKHPSEVRMYRCDKCDYQTKQRTNLTKHQIRHRDPSEILMYQCDQCEYKTSRRYCLKKHELRHKASCEVQMYSCDKCPHQTKRKSDLILHLMTHKHPSEVPVYKCDKCAYETCRKYNLNVHALRHKDSSELETYRCPECGYETNRKRNLKVHQLRHKEVSEAHTYRCGECDYATKMKRNLKRHVLRNHKAKDL